MGSKEIKQKDSQLQDFAIFLSKYLIWYDHILKTYVGRSLFVSLLTLYGMRQSNLAQDKFCYKLYVFSDA